MTARTIDLRARRYLRRLLRNAHEDGSIDAVVIVGSVARSRQVHLLSDLDVLIVADVVVPRPPPGVQVTVLSRQELVRRALQGDDFAQWSLLYGVPLAGGALCDRMRSEILPLVPWPDARVSLARAHRRLDDAEALWNMGDIEAAREEALYAISHLSRATLLSLGEFPLSRPELADQLRAANDVTLANVLDELFSLDEPAPDVVRRALDLAGERLARVRQR